MVYLRTIQIYGNANHKTAININNKHKPKNVVITGSTNGIGKSLAKQFINQGDNVIITSRISNFRITITIIRFKFK